MTLTRRSLFGGFAGLLAAPAIVKASSLMAVKPLPVPALAYPATMYEAYNPYLTAEEIRTFWVRINVALDELQAR